jgi:hypothetical protein
MRGFVFLGLVALLVMAAPASADHGRIGDQSLTTATSASNSANMELIGNSAKDGPVNSDLAFWGNLAYAGNYDGFRIVDVSDRSNPVELVDYFCPGSQNDVGVWDTRERGDGSKRLLFLSVDSRRESDQCGAGSDNVTTNSPPPFEGIRVFDVTTPQQPAQLAAVNTDCGSHTHTVIPADRQRGGRYVIDSSSPDRVLIYVSSYPLNQQNNKCGAPNVGDDPTHNKISIVEVPFDDPSKASVLKEEPLDPATRPFPDGSNSRGCHDFGAFLPLKLAAGACQGQGYLFDISDPADPKLHLSEGAKRIQNSFINYWHSASFTWDGKVLVFGDEEGGAIITHSCLNLSSTGKATGATWFYDRAKLAPGDNAGEDGSFVQTRQQLTSGQDICTAHNYTPIPVDDRYLLISAYYQAGSSMIDFSNLKAAKEIAYFDAQGGEEGNEASADTWSTYWYNGNPFANDINRGVDVFRLLNQPATLASRARRFDHLNPQTQEVLIRPRR